MIELKRRKTDNINSIIVIDWFNIEMLLIKFSETSISLSLYTIVFIEVIVAITLIKNKPNEKPNQVLDFLFNIIPLF